MLISEQYRALNEELHRKEPSWGNNANDDSKWTVNWIKGYSSVLDYGCGKGRLFIGCPDFRRYDPCVPEFASDPYPAELVICNKTLEHVEPECIDDVLEHIKSLTLRRVVIKVSTFLSPVRLHDGSYVHRIVEEPDWWLRKFIDRWSLRYAEAMERGLRFVGEKL